MKIAINRTRFASTGGVERYLYNLVKRLLADVFVVPSWFDAFANILLEALATGLPVIVSKKTGAHEIVTDCGLVIEEGESESALADAISTLLDENLRTALAAKAREKAETLSWDAHIKKCCQFIKSLHKKIS